MLQPLQVEAVHPSLLPDPDGLADGMVLLASRVTGGLSLQQRRRLDVVDNVDRHGRRGRQHVANYRVAREITSLPVRTFGLVRPRLTRALHERVQGQIEDYAHVSLVNLTHERGEVLQCAQLPVHVRHVANVRVIFRVMRRWEYRVQSDGPYSEVLQVVQPHFYPAQIADPVGTLQRVLEGRWKYLVEGAALPPFHPRVASNVQMIPREIMHMISFENLFMYSQAYS